MVVELTEKNGKIIKKKLISVDKKDLKDGNKLKIPEGITEIGEDALNLLRNRKVKNLQIKMADTVTKIGEQAFSGLHIQKIRLSDNLNEIGERAFASTVFVNKVEIPKSIKEIPEACFQEATFTHGIELPRQLECIKMNAFERTNMVELKIPNSVRILGNAVFKNSTIKKINLSKKIRVIPAEAFCYTKNLKKIEIPNSVVTIEEDAFFCSDVEKILLNDGLQRIKAYAFQSTNIKEISFPRTVYHIDHASFRDCRKLKNITFPLSLKYIGEEAFFNSGLETVILPPNVKIEYRAFQNNGIKQIQLSKEEYNQVKSKQSHAFRNNPALSDVYIYDWKTNNDSQFLPKRKVKKLGKKQR